MNNTTGYWDHKTKPSMFVVTKGGKEIHRGTFREGYKILESQRRHPISLLFFKFYKRIECIIYYTLRGFIKNEIKNTKRS
jgi:hypothetical protein